MPHIARARTDGAQGMPPGNMKEVAQNLATTQEEIQEVA
jgi:hypothetical protein